MSNVNRKFLFKYRTLHLIAGILAAVFSIWLLVDRFSGNDGSNLSRLSDSWFAAIPFAVLAVVFILSAIDTYILVTPDGITIKAPFQKICVTWDNIERVGAIKVPTSIYSEPGIVFKQPPYLRQTVYQRWLLPPLLDGKTLLLTSYLSDSHWKELEKLATQKLGNLSG